ncbi:MAG: outer membrane protein assembly factor BamD [Nitrospinae bacterium]|nr:outer membrane protein assembly factor BamD [Nitrospinota bacterium]MBL7019364.1 outer membrane protein assembly factor BamD [Nitrospinaceae bacterium]
MSPLSLASKFASFFTLVSVLVLFFGCATTKEEKNYSARQLLQQGKQFAKKNDTEAAKAKIQQLMEDFPDSKERVAATMLLADIHFKDEAYEEAKFHYQKFTELYPAHQFVDRAHFYKAMTNFKLTDLASRDLTPVNSALKDFQRFLEDFPQSSYSKPAQLKITQCLDLLAQNIFEIGKFYYRTGSYQSAIQRFKRLKAEYPDHSYILEAEFLLGESYYHEQNFSEASAYYKNVIKSSPRSKLAKEARLRLKILR